MKPVDDDDIFSSSVTPPVDLDDDDDLFKSAAPLPVKVEEKKAEVKENDLFTAASSAVPPVSSTPPAPVEKEIDLEDDDDDDIFKSARLEPEPAKVLKRKETKQTKLKSRWEGRHL